MVLYRNWQATVRTKLDLPSSAHLSEKVGGGSHASARFVPQTGLADGLLCLYTDKAGWRNRYT